MEKAEQRKRKRRRPTIHDFNRHGHNRSTETKNQIVFMDMHVTWFAHRLPLFRTLVVGCGGGGKGGLKVFNSQSQSS